MCLYLCDYNGMATYEEEVQTFSLKWTGNATYFLFRITSNYSLVSLEEIQFIRNKLLWYILLALTNESTQQEFIHSHMCYNAGIAAYIRLKDGSVYL